MGEAVVSVSKGIGVFGYRAGMDALFGREMGAFG